MCSLELSRQSRKGLNNLKQAGLSLAAKELADIIKENRLQNPPPYEKLVGNLAEKCSRQIVVVNHMEK